ncbi:hypothetical protein [Neptuniibacter sp. QD37_11]|uniref:hypothetical protein n=1 Tax=Neptuniibacter sp. QD37_11 TaxID=3398209 RepID=UPI0039F4A30D
MKNVVLIGPTYSPSAKIAFEKFDCVLIKMAEGNGLANNTVPYYGEVLHEIDDFINLKCAFTGEVHRLGKRFLLSQKEVTLARHEYDITASLNYREPTCNKAVSIEYFEQGAFESLSYSDQKISPANRPKPVFQVVLKR